MNRSAVLRTSTVLALLALAGACSDDDELLEGLSSAGGADGSGGDAQGSGGTATSGGATASGGATSTEGGATSTEGGATSTEGGATTTAGSTSTAAGAATGGATSTAGSTSTAGKTTGGAVAGGGAAGSSVGSGGSPSEAGTSNAAGTTGDAAGAATTGGITGAAGTAGFGGMDGAAGSTNQGTAGAPATAAYCASGTYAFCDDFEDGNADGWRPYNQTAANLGTWTIGSELGYNGVSSVDYQLSAPNPAASVGYHYQMAVPTAGPWENQTVSAWVKPNSDLGNDNTKIGICARMSNPSTTSTAQLTGYCIFLRYNLTTFVGEVQLGRKPNTQNNVSGMTGALASDLPVFATGVWVKVGISVVTDTSTTPSGAIVTGYINDTQVITATDPTPVSTTGVPGLITRQQAAAVPAGTGSFDNVTLTSP